MKRITRRHWSVRFGPDTQWIEHINYDVSTSSIPAFETAIRRYGVLCMPLGACMCSRFGSVSILTSAKVCDHTQTVSYSLRTVYDHCDNINVIHFSLRGSAKQLI